MDKQLLTAFLLGVVQGVAEFLPISSSGHLVLGETLLRRWTGISAGDPSATGGLFFNVALHLATLLAILVVYRAELRELPRRRRLVGMIVLASVPAAVVGLTLKDWFETAFQTPEVAGIGLLVTSVLLVAGQRWETRRDGLQDLTWQQALLVGMFQAAALVPGISRSGSTIAAGLLAGLRREAATTFSFLIAIPAIGGAALLESLDHVRQGGAGAAGGRPDWQALGIGMAAAFLFGLLSLRWLIGLVNRGRLARFACYTAAVGALTLVLCGVS